MSKQKSAAIVTGKGIGLSMVIYIGLQLFLAFLAVKGILPEKKLFPAQAVTAALAALAGSIYSARRSPMGTLPAALLAAGGFAAAVALLGFLLYDGLLQTWETTVRLLSICVGGILAGLAAPGGRKKKRKKIRTPVGKRQK